jgi:hypothetical protein
MFGEVKDLDGVLIKYLDDSTLLKVSATNHYFNNLCSDNFYKEKVLRAKNVKDIPKNKAKIIYFGINNLYDFANKIASVEDFEILEWLKSMGIFPMTLYASKYHSTKVLDWLVQNERSFTPLNFHEAVDNGRKDVADWLIAKNIYPVCEDVDMIAGTDWTDVLDIVMNRGILPKSINNAVKNNSLASVKWCMNHMKMSDRDLCLCLEYNRIEMVEYILQNDKDFSLKCRGILEHAKSFEMIKLLESRGLEINEVAIYDSIYAKNILVLSYLVDKLVTTTKYIDYALYHLNYEVCKYLMALGVKPSVVGVNNFYYSMENMVRNTRKNNEEVYYNISYLLLSYNIDPPADIFKIFPSSMETVSFDVENNSMV